MFERFTPSARNAVIRSQEEARALGHVTIAAGHVLLAIAVEGTGLGGKALARSAFDLTEAREALTHSPHTPSGMLDGEDEDALRTLGIDVDDVRRAVESSFGQGALERAHRRWSRRGHIPFAPESKKALELALREAIRLGDRHIGTEHLLLGLVRDPRTSAGAVLERQGITSDDVRRAVSAERASSRPGHTA
jgi:ATP-dependent Clp protease ATP-binding subunit ClpA